MNTMGRIKTKLVKRVGYKIFKDYSDKLKTDFQENKAIVTKLADFPSKKIANIVTGYVTRLMKQRE